MFPWEATVQGWRCLRGPVGRQASKDSADKRQTLLLGSLMALVVLVGSAWGQLPKHRVHSGSGGASCLVNILSSPLGNALFFLTVSSLGPGGQSCREAGGARAGGQVLRADATEPRAPLESRGPCVAMTCCFLSSPKSLCHLSVRLTGIREDEAEVGVLGIGPAAPRPLEGASVL